MIGILHDLIHVFLGFGQQVVLSVMNKWFTAGKPLTMSSLGAVLQAWVDGSFLRACSLRLAAVRLEKLLHFEVCTLNSSYGAAISPQTHDLPSPREFVRPLVMQPQKNFAQAYRNLLQANINPPGPELDVQGTLSLVAFSPTVWQRFIHGVHG